MHTYCRTHKEYERTLNGWLRNIANLVSLSVYVRSWLIPCPFNGDNGSLQLVFIIPVKNQDFILIVTQYKAEESHKVDGYNVG